MFVPPFLAPSLVVIKRGGTTEEKRNNGMRHRRVHEFLEQNRRALYRKPIRSLLAARGVWLGGFLGQHQHIPRDPCVCATTGQPGPATVGAYHKCPRCLGRHRVSKEGTIIHYDSDLHYRKQENCEMRMTKANERDYIHSFFTGPDGELLQPAAFLGTVLGHWEDAMLKRVGMEGRRRFVFGTNGSFVEDSVLKPDEAWLRVAEEKSKLANLRAIAADHVNFVNTVLRCGVHGTGHGLPPAQRSPLLKLRGDNKTEARLRIAEYLGVQVKEVEAPPRSMGIRVGLRVLVQWERALFHWCELLSRHGASDPEVYPPLRLMKEYEAHEVSEQQDALRELYGLNEQQAAEDEAWLSQEAWVWEDEREAQEAHEALEASEVRQQQEALMAQQAKAVADEEAWSSMMEQEARQRRWLREAEEEGWVDTDPRLLELQLQHDLELPPGW